MKIRKGFVSNSSSCSFIIKNVSNEYKTLYDFARENIYLVNEFLEEYDFVYIEESPKYIKRKVIEDAKSDRYHTVFKPGEKKELVFGDEDGTDIGRIYNYILRYGGESDNFIWSFSEMLR